MTPPIRKLLINIDGASLGNPGAAGIGVVVCDARGKILKKISEPIGAATNNVAEYTALIRALQEAASLSPPNRTGLLIRTDSELLQRQFTGEYRVKSPSLRELRMQVMALVPLFAEVQLLYVPREENSRADKLANEAARKVDG